MAKNKHVEQKETGYFFTDAEILIYKNSWGNYDGISESMRDS
jgi:hypothetical protein